MIHQIRCENFIISLFYTYINHPTRTMYNKLGEHDFYDILQRICKAVHKRMKKQ